MARDLTKFPFYALDFLHSDVVRLMSDAEVGQYILLLANAWVRGKDTTLPESDKLLCLIAQTPKVSDLVLGQFPVVETEWGMLRRNKRLYEIWLENQEKSEFYEERARKAAEVRHKNPSNMLEASNKYAPSNMLQADEARNEGGITSNVSKLSKVSNSRPHRLVSIDSPDTERLSDKQIQKLEYVEGLNPKKAFSRAADKWREAGRGKLQPLGGRAAEWGDLLDRYGSAHVLAAFHLWVQELSPDFTPYYAMTTFFKEAEQYLSAIRINLEAQEKPSETDSFEELARKSVEEENEKVKKENEVWEAKKAEEKKLLEENWDKI